MAKRIVTKIGDVFCVEVDNEYKCFFQYVANDMTVLNSSVIRVFKEHYPIDYKPNLDEIVRGNVHFYAHTILRKSYIGLSLLTNHRKRSVIAFTGLFLSMK